MIGTRFNTQGPSRGDQFARLPVGSMAGEGALPILLVKPARLQDSATKSWVPGSFILHPTKITWQPASHESGVKELHVGLISVTNTQRAKNKPQLRLVAGTSGFTFEFDSELDRDSAVDAYAKAKEVLQQQPTAATAAGPRAAVAAGGAGASSSAGVAGKRAAAGKVGAGSKAGASAYTGPLPDAGQKREMLRADAELGERYNTLVAAAGVLSEDEFWAGVMAERVKAAAVATAGGGGAGGAAGAGAGGGAQAGGLVTALPPPPGAAEQQKGLSNAMFQVPVEQDGRTVAMRFTLTPDIIAMVFAEKPNVKRIYQAQVPAAMSEKEFWTRYIKHEMAKEERRKRLVEASASATSETDLSVPPLEHSKLFGAAEGAGGPGNSLEANRRVRRKLQASDPLVNIAADDADHYSQGFGLLHAANKEPVAKAGLRAMAEDLAHDINRHATIVLAGCKAIHNDPNSPPSGGKDAQQDDRLDQLAAERVAQYGSGLEDLKPRLTEEFEVLHLHNQPELGLDGEEGAAGGAGAQYGDAGRGAGGGAGGEVPRWLRQLDPNNLNHQPVDATSAYKVLLEVCGLSVEAGGAGGSVVVAGQQAPDVVLAPALVSKLRTQVKMVCDVARHFWSCMPPTTPELRDKAERLATHVDKVLWPEVDGTLRSANSMGGPQRPAVRALLKPALDMMEAVLERRNTEKEAGRL